MGSTFSTSYDRKSLKKPDSFILTVRNLFTGVSKQTGLALAAVVFFLGVGVSISMYMNHLAALSDQSRNALYSAEKSLESDLKRLAALEGPFPGASSKTPQEKLSTLTSTKNQKKGASKAQAEEADQAQLAAQMEAVVFKKMDVDQNFADTVAKFKVVDAQFGKTRSAFEARLKLGDLYYRHADFSKALPWYEKAIQSAPNSFEKAVALSAIGYTHESLGKPTEAIQAFQKALNLGEGTLKGDLLLGLARSYEAANDLANARSTYDKILAELPNTDYSKSAELFKSRIQ